jgi:arylsulfatase A-like enzyme
MTKPLLLAIGALLTAFCTPGPGSPAAPRAVLLVTFDTTRADRLSPYGFMDVSMPALDRMGREGVVFDQATSVAPLTMPAHASVFTGLLPLAHGVRDNAGPPLRAEALTLAEILQAQGFRTAAFVGSDVLHADRGLAQGFDHYSGVLHHAGRTTARQRPASEVVADATQWLDAVGDSRFFLWTHLYDPHRPYDPPEPFASRHASDLYVGEIAYADSQFGRLLDALDRQHLINQTIVIVAGDHGESLGEHGERDHGVFIYESVLRIPMIIRAPGVAPRRVGRVVRLIDVMPTVLDLLGLQAPAVDGVSLVTFMRGGGQDLEAYSESEYPRQLGWSPLRALRDGRFKLIDAPRPELYDLEQDPFEERNVYHQRRATADALMRRLDIMAQTRSRTSGNLDANAVAPREVRERLAALGYVGARAVRASPAKELPDPKDCIGQEGRPCDPSPR